MAAMALGLQLLSLLIAAVDAGWLKDNFKDVTDPAKSAKILREATEKLAKAEGEVDKVMNTTASLLHKLKDATAESPTVNGRLSDIKDSLREIEALIGNQEAVATKDLHTIVQILDNVLAKLDEESGMTTWLRNLMRDDIQNMQDALRNENKGMVIVDIRTKANYLAGHIMGAHLFSEVDLSKCPDMDVLYYCDTGMAAKLTARRRASKDSQNTHYALGSYAGIKEVDPQLIEIGEPAAKRDPCTGHLSQAEWMEWVEPEQEENAQDDHSLPVGAIVAIAVTGAIAGMTATLIAVYCVYRARMKKEAAALAAAAQVSAKVLPADVEFNPDFKP